MKCGDLVRMISGDSVCADEMGIVLESYGGIDRYLVLFYEKGCSLACKREELKIIGENAYFDGDQAQA